MLAKPFYKNDISIFLRLLVFFSVAPYIVPKDGKKDGRDRASRR